jgi:hypothetical protein
VLFPVRILFTAQTGQIGRNEAAVEYCTKVETGPAGDLSLPIPAMAVNAYTYGKSPTPLLEEILR